MCERVALPGGGFAIVCGTRRGRRSTCAHCGRPASLLCDGPARDGGVGTCDRALCTHCRIHVPPDRDYCKGHREAARDAAAQLRHF